MDPHSSGLYCSRVTGIFHLQMSIQGFGGSSSVRQILDHVEVDAPHPEVFKAQLQSGPREERIKKNTFFNALSLVPTKETLQFPGVPHTLGNCPSENLTITSTTCIKPLPRARLSFSQVGFPYASSFMQSSIQTSIRQLGTASASLDFM